MYSDIKSVITVVILIALSKTVASNYIPVIPGD
jgi:hypothetical protein